MTSPHNHMAYLKHHVLMTVDADHHRSLRTRLGTQHVLTKIQGIKTKESHGAFQFAEDKARLEAVSRSILLKRARTNKNKNALKEINVEKVDSILVTSEAVHDDIDEIYHATIEDECGILNQD
ncbi:tegument protein UL14 [Elephantid betaherpesvirus 1]|uniref:Protein U68 n=2 Tax=Elephantid herpesvirus 1 TaxID=146015 RepID=UL96_ELHVK|nr:tegument protein UL14 [Elephantid betaherpesvirus 1]Q18LD1.1 RecName: Full=Protein U68 [Elephantid herpesvirus 1 (isolate Kiba)]ABG36588.1 U68 [Elephantid betaherpesvirus 1]AGE09954.1 tegument protein UL14 [Elephantid betaherpesvirus 1]AGE10061.1 tegument protein UL14 [Elephantid betaherpesvirus 1]WES72426.1 tegument protein U68 [Elephantid betaherpesvirus 1]